MTEETKRTVLNARVLVETSGTAHEHSRTVQWAATRLKTAHAPIKDGYVAVQITSSTGEDLGMGAHGQPSEETEEILNDIFEVSDDHTT